MALTRAFLRGLQLTDEQVSAIIEAHAETVDGLKAVNSDLQGKLDAAAADAEKAKDFESQYNTVSKELESYRAEVEGEAARRAKQDAYKALLIDAGVSGKRIDAIMRCDSDAIDALEIDDAGGVKDAETVTSAIKESWGDFITSAAVVPAAPVATPPTAPAASYSAADLRGMSAAEINANWDAVKASLSNT